MADTPARRWLKARVPKPKHKSCKRGGRHRSSLYMAKNRPFNVTRFGEWGFVCSLSKKCPAQIFPLDKRRRLKLRPQFEKLFMGDERDGEQSADSDSGDSSEPSPPPPPKKKSTKKKRAAVAISSDSDSNPPPPKKKSKKKIVVVVSSDSDSDSDTPPAKKKTTKNANAGPNTDPTNPKEKGKGKAAVAASESPSPPPKRKTRKMSDATPKIHSVTVNKKRSRTVTASAAPGDTEADEYDTDSYQIPAGERRRVELAIFTDSDKPVIRSHVNLRAVNHFKFKSFKIASVVRAVSEDTEIGLPYTSYLWFCPLKLRWSLLNDSAINLQPRGNILILREASIPEKNCVGLLELIEEAVKSVLAHADSGSEPPPSSLPSSSLASRGMQASAAGPSSLKRKRG
ncbi:hypothetical protein B0H13DRAFT_1866201 [Mycena leptocephala]|nr:hypothetical protein B0H13DRAFT_1866201 [Mycena leptocephala]